MRIAFLEIENFRGIRQLKWGPAAKVNCLIGPGDSTKTTILDAIELALNPRSNWIADDCDFYNLDTSNTVKIRVTIIGLPPELKADSRYGLHLRGWNEATRAVEDEPGEGLEDALSLQVVIDESLEARWSLFNEWIGENGDPPSVRFKDVRRFATTRLGPYADGHLSWGRQSVLTRLGETAENIRVRLAQAGRAAREGFHKEDRNVFADIVARAEVLSRQFSVPVRDKYAAELDLRGVALTAGGIALHDGKLPLRRLGTGSSRLIVSALQHDAGLSHLTLIDEVEYGLEPHRIARLLKFLKSSIEKEDPKPAPQIFMTTHSPVVICELNAPEVLAVRSDAGVTKVLSIAAHAKDVNAAQRYLRGSPAAYLAPRIAVGEGKTEQGLLRGLDGWWSSREKESFALRGVVPVDGSGITNAPVFAEHLLDLGYGALVLLDSDEAADDAAIERIKAKGGTPVIWPDNCSTEERIFLDVPWATVAALIKFAVECVGADSVLANIKNECKAAGVVEIADLTLPASLDSAVFRRALGKAAKRKGNSWFKDVARGEQLAAIIAPCLDGIKDKALAKGIASIRHWIDG